MKIHREVLLSQSIYWAKFGLIVLHPCHSSFHLFLYLLLPHFWIWPVPLDLSHLSTPLFSPESQGSKPGFCIWNPPPYWAHLPCFRSWMSSLSATPSSDTCLPHPAVGQHFGPPCYCWPWSGLFPALFCHCLRFFLAPLLIPKACADCSLYNLTVCGHGWMGIRGNETGEDCHWFFFFIFLLLSWLFFFF